ncbi:alanine acetyltransferase [Pseudoxanthomonas kalamensis DSM 18571]|nr:alanine acetyltransferase [Pseudoxanthomonas kalamensis]KAF1708972.1 alanine acetyltransferase [Pseudoxanthomonas kalamensis DSM 18571]
MPPLWTAEQHGWLEALGHKVWIAGSLPAAAQQAPVTEAHAETTTRVRETAPPPRRAPVPPPATDTPPASNGFGRRLPTRVPDRLHFALIRASGCNPSAPGMAEVIAQWPPSAELRGNPAAKRALWPRLRALRKVAGTP